MQVLSRLPRNPSSALTQSRRQCHSTAPHIVRNTNRRRMMTRSQDPMANPQMQLCIHACKCLLASTANAAVCRLPIFKPPSRSHKMHSPLI
eukprot:925504-Pelagomonas_calceolata.AAC.5